MDIFTRFSRRTDPERQLDTLIGISKGMVADGKINQAEAEFLLNWLIQNQQYDENPVISNLLQKVSYVLADGVLDDSEAADLLQVLTEISGEKTGAGEFAWPTTLPLDNPPPQIVFEGRKFLFTGTCVYGTRKECHSAVEKLGGHSASDVSEDLDYLVIGTYVTDNWADEPIACKIEKAMNFRNSGRPIAIIDEETWIEQAGF